MSADVVSVEVLGWDSFNGRKDVKKPSWFRLEYRLLEDPDFFNFSHGEFKAWLYVLAQACRKNTGTIRLNYEHAKSTARLSRQDIDGALDKLEELQLVHVHVTHAIRERDANATDTIRDRTGQDSTEQDKTGQIATELTLDRGRGKGIATWEAYRSAYSRRYGEPPIRNASVNAKIAQFVNRVGADEAPLVAEFFLTHNDAFYVKSMHGVGLMLRDAEKLRTEWVTGRKVTGAVARSAEKADGYQDQLRRIQAGTL